MKFIVIEKVRGSAIPTSTTAFAKLVGEDLKYHLKLVKEGKIVSGGPCLDILAVCYILETNSIDEMGDIFFNSPGNLFVEREVHPLGSFEDTSEGIKEMAKKK